MCLHNTSHSKEKYDPISDTLPSLPPGFWRLNWGGKSVSRSTNRTFLVFWTGTSKNSISIATQLWKPKKKTHTNIATVFQDWKLWQVPENKLFITYNFHPHGNEKPNSCQPAKNCHISKQVQITGQQWKVSAGSMFLTKCLHDKL